MVAGAIVGSAVTAVGVGGLLAAEARRSIAGRWIAKPIASAGFLATALAAGAAGSAWGHAVLVAFALCWLGDVLLIPESRVTFQLGLASFLAGHVAFAVGFARRGVDGRATAGAAAALAVSAIVVGRWLLPHVERAMRPPVIAYIAAISTMVALAVGATVRGGPALALAGALAFYASDLSVARDTFVARGFVNRAWGLPAYYGAQLALAWSVAV